MHQMNSSIDYYPRKSISEIINYIPRQYILHRACNLNEISNGCYIKSNIFYNTKKSSSITEKTKTERMWKHGF